MNNIIGRILNANGVLKIVKKEDIYECFQCKKKFAWHEDCMTDGEISICSSCADKGDGWINCEDCGKLVNGTYYAKDIGGLVCSQCAPKHSCTTKPMNNC